MPNLNISKITQAIHEAAKEERDNEQSLVLRIESILKESGFDWGRYEYNTARHSGILSGGRVDALHSFVVIEYESPGSFSSKPKFAHSVDQLTHYISDLSGDDKDKKTRYFGVALDGLNFGFVRYKSKTKTFEAKGPLEVNENTVGRFIEAIVGLHKKALGADELLRDFGPESPTARGLILSLYESLESITTDRTQDLFTDWKRVFSQICSYSPTKLKGLESKYGLTKKNVDVERLLFALHTYFALVMKLLAAEVASTYVPSGESYLKKLEESYYKGYQSLGNELEDLEKGGVFVELGINNFLEGDYFRWYLDEWSRTLADNVSLLIRKLSDYDPSTAELEPDRIRDLFKRLYQNLVPKTVRHDLGEYYTPDWLAELILDEVGYQGGIEKSNSGAESFLDFRLLDPACGSGTFLILALRRVKDYIEVQPDQRRSALEKITSNIVGYDLNPLAVMASRTNYLIAIADLLRLGKRGGGIEIPVYLADSIMVEQKATVLGTNSYLLRTAVGSFEIPQSIVEGGLLSRILHVIGKSVESRLTRSEFASRLSKEARVGEGDMHLLTELFQTILKLERQKRDEIWLNILKNSFAPLLMERFDFVVGNPPWINWESLPSDYRDSTKELWFRYGLFTLSGMEARLGGGKKDISILFAYRCIDRYLKQGGRFGFLITESAFKSKGAGQGFRRFKIGENPLKVIKALDFVRVHPFEGANNRTPAIILENGQKTHYPVSYELWTGATPDLTASLDEVSTLKKAQMLAIPSNPNDALSPWSALPRAAMEVISRAKGQSSYKPHTGLYTGGANAIYWFEALQQLASYSTEIDHLGHLTELLDFGKIQMKDVLVKNIVEGAHKEVAQKTVALEDYFLYPLIKSRHLNKWKIDGYTITLQVQDPVKKVGYPEAWMKTNFPKTYSYLKSFEKELRGRAAYKKYLQDEAFYSMYDVSEATFSPYKVVWNQMGNSLEACVISEVRDRFLGQKLLIPEHVLGFMGTTNELEAHYICAILNSSFTGLLLSSIGGGSKSFGTPKLMESTVNIPKFEPDNKTHARLASLSKQAHDAAQNSPGKLHDLEAEIDKAVSNLYGLDDADLIRVKEALKFYTKKVRSSPDDD